jgi:hypothetical protein
MCRKACIKEPSRRNYDTERTAYICEKKKRTYKLQGKKPEVPSEGE